MAIVREDGGRDEDHLEHYRWPFLVGGTEAGNRVPAPERSWKLGAIEVGEETYYRKRNWFGPAQIDAFVGEDWSKGLSWLYRVFSDVFSSHHELEKLTDIDIWQGRKNPSGPKARP